VVITVDQFRADFLDRFAHLFGPGGFRRLLKDGAFFANANYDYVPTYTAPGHAAIFTGAGPAQNGIVGNTWFDRAAGRVRIMVSDTQVRTIGTNGVVGEAGAPSPRVLLGSTLGDQMRLSNNYQSKVVAVALKDRSAVLPGGHNPNGAYWFDNRTGSFVTSDYYTKELPGWVKTFNTKERPDKYFGRKWERTLSADAYKIAQTENTPAQRSTLGSKFPYTVTGGEEHPGPRFYSAFEITPFASEYLWNFARTAVESESLGSDEFPDLLAISFSSPDLAGHYYGPDSQELVDTWVRLDRLVADLLVYLDRRVGASNFVVAVSGDHGVAPVPEYLQSRRIDSGRINPRDITNAVGEALKQKFGDKKWVLGFVNEQVYLDHKLIAEQKLNASEVEQVSGEAALAVPGIVAYYTRTQIAEGRMPPNPIARRIQNGFHPARCGDVWLVTKPFYFVAEGALATTHGSPYNYDTHVPIVLLGPGVRAGRYFIECSPADIAPTLSALLGIETTPNRVGRVLPAIGAH
ncbi:MAG TPA: alkaline phosphatase family protein, partial [Blastocatellia bacterium]|nr:alkaline phosphatase family protein [Blastocatellia bacterium]